MKNLDGKKLLLRVVIVILCVLAHQRPAVGQGWSNGYGFRRAITIDHTQVPNTDQANFPVLVSGTFASLATTANGGNVTNANGYDIILTSDAAGTTLLPFEQEVYNPSTGAIVYWVKIPTVSHTSDTVFYLFYGNSSISTSQSNKNGVWDSNYVGVWHLPNGSTLNANDSTSNANNGTINGATPTNGEIDGAASLNGSNQNITVNKQYGLTSNLTFSAWVKFSGLSGYQEILGQDTSSWTGGNAALYFQKTTDSSPSCSRPANALGIILPTNSSECTSGVYSSSPVSTGTWYYAAGSYNGSTLSLYINGSLAGSTSRSGSIGTQTGNLSIGSGYWTSSVYDHLNGVIDEVRISNVARSADWVSSEYNNQSSPSSFAIVGSAAQGPAGVTINRLLPSNASQGDVVTIQGTNFGNSQGGSTVSLNGVSLIPQSWSSTAIVVTVPFGASSGTFSVTVNGQTAVSPAFTVKTVPSGWTDADLGAVGMAGSGSYSNGTFTLKASGSIWGTADSGHIVYQPLTGDGTVVARVVSLQGGGASQEAGVLIRETLNASAKNVYMAWGGGRPYQAWRSTTGGSTSAQTMSNVPLPYWVKLVRSGNTFTGYMAVDGVNWVQVSSQTITMAQNVYLAIATSAENGNGASLGTAVLDNVSVNTSSEQSPVIASISAAAGIIGSQVVISGSGFGNSQGNSLVYLNGTPVTINTWSANSITITIPSGATSGMLVVTVAPNMDDSNPVPFIVANQPVAGWLDSDVGQVGLAGSSSFANGVFTVKGSGQSIWNTADGMHFDYQSLSGDGSIAARVVSLTGTGTPQAGVMIRETLSPASDNVYMAYQLNQSPPIKYLTRLTSGASTTAQNGSGNPALPYWVRVTRSGNSFSGFASLDGVNWTQIGTTQTINMAQNVYVGLAVSSDSNSVLATATFDNVSVSSVGNSVPAITNVSATTGAIGSQVTINGTGFGATQGGSLVTLNGSPMTINSWASTSIVITISAGATSGPLSVSVAPAMNASNPVEFQVTTHPLPTLWVDQDVSAVGLVGSATYSNGMFTINGAGLGFSTNIADGLHFVYQPLSGDGVIVARLVTSSPVAGLMIRETTDPGARTVANIFLPGSSYYLMYERTSPGASISSQFDLSKSTLPYWMKLARSGNTFTGYTSPDGVNWVQLGTSQTVNMAQSLLIGLVSSSGSTTSLATATFDSVSVTSDILLPPVITGVSATTGPVGSQVTISGTGFGATQGSSLVMLNGLAVTINSWNSTSISITIPAGATTGPLEVLLGPSMNSSNPVDFEVTSQPLPLGWLDQDIGAVGLVGSATYSSGTFTINGAGQGFGAMTADGLHFVYQPLSGDGVIVARLVTSSPVAGLMIRETTDPGARTVANIFLPGSSYYLMYERTSPGASISSQFDLNKSTLPYWMKLARTGNSFAGYASADGVNWVQLGTNQTVNMAQGVYIGFVVSSGSPTSLATATFDSSSFAPGTMPIVSSITPDAGGQGASATITGNHFGSPQGTSSITFNGTPATSVTSWTNTQIVATVPTNATTGPVVVTVNSIQSNTNVAFTVFKPVLTSITPSVGQVGATVTLAGSGFGASQGTSQVLFNGTSAAVSSWGDSSITVNVPNNATSGPVTVVEGGVTSNNISFSVENLSVTNISPNFGPVGTAVTITGAGFGPSQSNSAVFFFGTSAAAVIQSWSDNQIIATVPSGTASGQVEVEVGSIIWYGPYFTVTTTLQLTDSKSDQTSYTAVMVGGNWRPSAVQGSGCSTCTQRGNISYTYDSKGNVASRTDENGHTTTYGYDPNNDVLSVTVPISSGHTATTTYTYDSLGDVLTVTDPLGYVTTNTYDAKGNLLSVTTPAPGNGPAASVTQFTYNSLGQLTKITDPLNNQTSMAYFPSGLIQTVTDAQSNVTTYAYDSQGNRTSVTDALSKQTTFTYDAMNRLTKITYPDTTTTQFGYDSRGRRTSVTDQNNKQTTYAYDDADRLITVTDAATNVTTYGYDTESNLTSIQDANHNTTNFYYDAFGRVTQTTFPSGYIETYGYDNVGNLTSKTDRKNQLITYTYDQLNRLTLKSYPDTTTVNYTYDNDSRLTQVTDATGTYQFTFDNMGRLSGTSTQYAFLTGRSFTTSYGYDAASNRTSFTDPETGSSSYAYDTLNRLQTLTPPVAISGGSFGLGYDALSRRTSLTRPNSVNTSYGYDNLSRLLNVTHAKGSTTLDGASYTVDNAGNRLTRTPQPTGAASTFGYDNIYELLSVTQGGSTTESYTYDPVGNRLTQLGSSSWTYNTSNELTARPSVTYTFDANGNTIVKTDGTGSSSYAWDFENRLASVILPGSGGTVTFKYDPFGRRIEKVSPTTTSIFAYDGDNLIEETNASGTSVARYSQGLNIDEPLAMLRSSTTSYYEADGLGSLTSLSNTSGALAQTYTFDSFGNQTASSGSLTNPFRYTGREFDTETSLYYYRARYYDEQAGRFLSEDPIRFNSNVNFFPYSANSPLNVTDPSGDVIVVRTNDPTIWPITQVYLCGSPQACAIINELQASPEIFVINISDTYKRDVAIGRGTIFWNPHQAMCVKNGAQSPAIQVLHELVHLWQWKHNLPRNEELAVQLTNPAAEQLGEPIRLNYADAGKNDPTWPMSIPIASKEQCGCQNH